MKRFILSVAIAVAVGCAGLAWAGIEGSKHDFSKTEWASGDKCGACHTPHIENPPDAAPLWDADADISQRFGSSLMRTADANLGTTMCLRCHDGTLAKDNIGGVTRQRYADALHPSLFSSAHGINDHPVGVEYPRSNRQYVPMTTVLSKGTVRLPNGRVECSSCHDPHNASGEPYMLVMSNDRSALCLACHIK